MADESIEALRIRFEPLNRLLTAIGIAAVIAAFWVPLRAVAPIVSALAGKTTNVVVTATVSIGITLALGGSAAALIVKDIKKRRELERLRERNIGLERNVATLQTQVEELTGQIEQLKRQKGKPR